MSYPSVNKHLNAQGVDINNANEKQLSSALLSAFKEDLPLGFARVTELVDKMKQAGGKVTMSLSPNSDEGKQYIRLLAADIPRQVLEKHFDVSFGFYNCGCGVAAPTKKALDLTLREQIEAQHPNFVDC